MSLLRFKGDAAPMSRVNRWRPLGLAFIGAAMVSLAACSSNTEELNKWADQQRLEIKPSVDPISPPGRFMPQGYIGMTSVDPFSTQKLAVAFKQEAKQPNSLLAGEMNRRKEPLESYPIDGMVMVGSVNKQGRQTALLKVDNLLYQVKVGDHLGQDYGKVTQVSETGIQLREIVQDASGEWVERTGSLHLQEKAQ